jgi:hypothetical protein
VERGSLLPLSRRELAPDMAGKKRLTLARGDYRQSSQACLLGNSGGKPPLFT